LEACYFGDVVVEPKSAAVVWWADEPIGCSARVVTDDDSTELLAGPHRSADVGGVVPWLPLMSKQVQCTTAIPPLFRQSWLKSGRCRPDALETVIDVPSDTEDQSLGRGKATLIHVLEAAAGAAPAAPTAAGPFQGFVRAQFRQLRGLEVTARGHRAFTAVAYEPFAKPELGVILPMALDDASGSFEFLLGGQRLGSVTIQHQPPDEGEAPRDASARGSQIACAQLAPAVGIQSVLLGTESLRRYYRTAITHIDGSVFAPLCFDQGRRAVEGILTFASGWSPRTAHRIELPCNMLPAKLSLQTAAGEWLGTLVARAPLGDAVGACWLNVQALEWSRVTQPALRYPPKSSSNAEAAPELEVSVPAITQGFGSIAWSVVRAPTTGDAGTYSPALAVEGSGDELVISSTGAMRRAARQAPSYIYLNGSLVRGTCPPHTVEKPSAFAENLARSRGLSFSKVTLCAAPAAASPLVASGS
jgi:hypothetical protein